tara:strand:+ start:229 stop:471 length:243 start_codon:yes stop_codon:yes gene_type:complete
VASDGSGNPHLGVGSEGAIEVVYQWAIDPLDVAQLVAGAEVRLSSLADVSDASYLITLNHAGAMILFHIDVLTDFHLKSP